jgi:hypothetical protein
MSGPWDLEPDALNAIMHVYAGTYMINFNAFLKKMLS